MRKLRVAASSLEFRLLSAFSGLLKGIEGRFNCGGVTEGSVVALVAALVAWAAASFAAAVGNMCVCV